MEKSGMRKRRVGNYLKAYPHIYEVFQNAINIQILGVMVIIIGLFFLALIALFSWLIGEKDMCTLSATLMAVLVFVCAFFLTLKTGMISLEELELMEKDLAGEKELVRNWGYSMEESFLIGFCRIPRKGLNTVYFGQTGLYNGFITYVMEFYYEDCTHLSTELRKLVETSDEVVFAQLIHKYDNSVKICRYKKLEENAPLFCPYKKFNAEVPSVRKATLEEINVLGSGNLFWWLRAKSRDKWDGNKEVEITLYGTALTWLFYLVWLCLSICLFFYIGVQSEALAPLTLLVAGLCYYLFFVKNARKITDKAMDIFYRDFFGNLNEQ